MKNTTILLLFCTSALGFVNGQQQITIEAAIDTALQYNRQFKINEAEIRSAEYGVKTAVELPKTGVFYENEDIRPSDNIGILKIGVSQSFAWPGLYAARKTYFMQQLKYAELNTEVLNTIVKRDVRTAYYQLWYLQDKQALYLRLDSIYSVLASASELRVKTGEAAALDQISAEAKLRELQAFIEQNKKDVIIQQQQLMLLLNKNEWLLPVAQSLEKMNVTLSIDQESHPILDLQQQNVAIAASNIAIQRNNAMPELSGRFFTQRMWGAKDPFTGFSVTASFPLFGIGAYRNNVRVANTEKEVQEETFLYQSQLFQTQRATILSEIEKSNSLLQFYETTGLKQADEIIKAATLSYNTGEISFAELSQFLSQAIGIRQNYLDVLNQYNQSAIQLNYINNK